MAAKRCPCAPQVMATLKDGKTRMKVKLEFPELNVEVGLTEPQSTGSTNHSLCLPWTVTNN